MKPLAWLDELKIQRRVNFSLRGWIASQASKECVASRHAHGCIDARGKAKKWAWECGKTCAWEMSADWMNQWYKMCTKMSHMFNMLVLWASASKTHFEFGKDPVLQHGSSFFCPISRKFMKLIQKINWWTNGPPGLISQGRGHRKFTHKKKQEPKANPTCPAAEQVRTAGQRGSNSHEMGGANLANKPQPRWHVSPDAMLCLILVSHAACCGIDTKIAQAALPELVDLQSTTAHPALSLRLATPVTATI